MATVISVMNHVVEIEPDMVFPRKPLSGYCWRACRIRVTEKGQQLASLRVV